MQKPIACSLDATGAKSQLDEWQGIFRAVAAAVERLDGTHLRVRLHDNANYASLIALSRREVECCPFFEFALEIQADQVWFTAAVPLGGAPVLDGFAQLAES